MNSTSGFRFLKQLKRNTLHKYQCLTFDIIGTLCSTSWKSKTIIIIEKRIYLKTCYAMPSFVVCKLYHSFFLLIFYSLFYINTMSNDSHTLSESLVDFLLRLEMHFVICTIYRVSHIEMSKVIWVWQIEICL